jgi:hypothetical protein
VQDEEGSEEARHLRRNDQVDQLRSYGYASRHMYTKLCKYVHGNRETRQLRQED